MVDSQILWHFLDAFNPILLNYFTVICFLTYIFLKFVLFRILKFILTISKLCSFFYSLTQNLLSKFYEALMLAGH